MGVSLSEQRGVNLSERYCYRAILCDKDAYLLELVRYIHLNPVRAKVVTDPEGYVWTSHLSYLGKGEEGLVDTDLGLAQFGGNRLIARRKYRGFIQEGVDGGHEAKFYEVKEQRFLGEEEFVSRIEDEKRRGERVTYDIPIEVIAREVSKAKGIGIERLYTLTRERKGVQAEGWCVSGEGTGGSEGEGDCGAFSAEFDEDKPGDH